METTGDVFIKGNEEGVQTQLTSLKQRLESAKAEITAIKEEMATLLKAEINPQVGTVTDGKWCTANAGQVECTQEAPLLSFTETDPQVGTVTDGKWCTANAGQVECTQEAPLAAAPSGSLLGFCSASCDGNGCRCGSATAPAICLSQACYCEDGYTSVSVNRGNTAHGYHDVILCIKN
jgi:hypothetical protein